MARENVVLNGEIQCGESRDREYRYGNLLLWQSEYPSYFYVLMSNAKTSIFYTLKNRRCPGKGGKEDLCGALLPP